MTSRRFWEGEGVIFHGCPRGEEKINKRWRRLGLGGTCRRNEADRQSLAAPESRMLQRPSAPERARCKFYERVGCARACTVRIFMAERARARALASKAARVGRIWPLGRARAGRIWSLGRARAQNRYLQGRHSGALGRHANARAPALASKPAPLLARRPSGRVGLARAALGRPSKASKAPERFFIFYAAPASLLQTIPTESHAKISFDRQGGFGRPARLTLSKSDSS